MNKSDQTRQGIARARARGIAWGAYAAVLAQQNRERADQFAVSLRPPILQLMLARRRGPVKLARELNRIGVHTSRGGKWHPATVDRLLRRLPGLREELAKAREAKHQEIRSTLQDNLAKLQAGNPGAFC